MKIKLLNTIIQTGTNIKFHKGKIYSAIAATNQPGAIRLVNKKKDIAINKVFVQRGNDSMLVENDGSFEFVEIPEYKELLENYKQLC